MSEVERGWFAEFFGTDETEIYCTPQNREAEWDDVAEAASTCGGSTPT
jgi:hypothetical protein